jgi:hypothetical protein
MNGAKLECASIAWSLSTVPSDRDQLPAHVLNTGFLLTLCPVIALSFLFFRWNWFLGTPPAQIAPIILGLLRSRPASIALCSHPQSAFVAGT